MGRTKKKPEYDQNKIMEQFQNCIVEAYTSGISDGTGISLRQVSEEYYIDENTKNINHCWCISY